MKASDFKIGDIVAFDFPEDGKLAGTEFIATVTNVDDGFVHVDTGIKSDDADYWVKLEPSSVRKVTDASLFKKRLEGKNIGMEGYLKWANGS